MKALLHPKYRFAIALGASLGIGHALFRGLTANLGPIWGLLAGTVSVAVIALVISLLLDRAARHAAARS
jgi:ABC-type proline/glycine betaine transport system permease subunit